jgi:hypothetical protein
LESTVEHGATITAASGNIVLITASDVEIEGFVIDGTGGSILSPGLRLSGPNAKIINNRFIGNSPAAGK